VSHKPIFYIKYFLNIIFHPHFILTFYQNKFHPNYMFLNFHLYFIPIVTTHIQNLYPYFIQINHGVEVENMLVE